MVDHFAHKASSYEANRDRVDNVAQIASAIIDQVRLDPSMHIMDFGSGTGLLLERVAPRVGQITAVDVSESMNARLREKVDRVPCPVDILQVDLEVAALDRQFDGIMSSMTMHHIKDVAGMFRKFHAMLHERGFIAIADLELEDGTFHGEDTGVHHTGFDKPAIVAMAVGAGFNQVAVSRVSVVHKEQGDYPVFLLTGIR